MPWRGLEQERALEQAPAGEPEPTLARRPALPWHQELDQKPTSLHKRRHASTRRWLLLPTIATLALLAILAPLGTAVPGAGQASAAPQINALATVGMVGDVVAQVGGACVQVTTLMGPGIDPHTYRASARDLRNMQAADIIFYAGLTLEGQLADVLDRLAARRPTVAVSEAAIPAASLVEANDDRFRIDPHVWMDPSLWTLTVDVVRERLTDLAPECADEFTRRAAAYQEQLAALHEWIKESVASLPAEHRVLVTAHDAFYYYGRAYGLEVHGIQGISTEAEAGLADIRAVTELVIERQVPAIFVESSINPRNIEAVQAAVRAKGLEVAIGGELYSDALGAAGTWHGTYIGMLVHNTTTIVEALGGRVAPLPAALADWADHWQVPLPVQPSGNAG